MIDLRAARNDPDGYRAALARKGAAEVFDALLAADVQWRELQQRVDELRARTKLKGKPTPDQLAELTALKTELQPLEAELAETTQRLQDLHDRVPNPPAEDTPDGNQEEDAVVVRVVGEPPSFDFEPRDHLDLSAAHGWIDVERGAKVSGSRFVYRVGDVALLEIALYRWALARIVQKGHTPMLPPVLVRDEAMYGTAKAQRARTSFVRCLELSPRTGCPAGERLPRNDRLGHFAAAGPYVLLIHRKS